MLMECLPSVDIKAVWVDSKDKHGNIWHRTDVDELLDGIQDVSFIKQKVEGTLNRITYGVNN